MEQKEKTPLSKLLEDRGIKQRWLARQIGMPETSLSFIVQGKRIPTLPVAMRIARVLGVTVEELWGHIVDDEG
ncbi:helix-turn-helix transcriptional regulator [Alicyclobacillus acidocaldarius]|uniref:helix-turn-helix transcriptional regulator n=1 Tax=Alicyclobacillus acidocaldarius TaxID=405212 RepID=UPI0005A0E241|nr:helix-turn-helix transcriptional regulator [Alicyclobacillus acidocaldarius]